MVIQRNINHLQQASPTPFGHGKGYELLHGPERHITADKILNGTLEWKYPMEEVNEWVDQLQRAYKEDELQQEVDNINRPISEDEFIKYFKNKDELTKSSPSGRHIGHYIAILNNDDLVSLITAMLNIGLIAGTALKRWKQTLSVMLEKDPGSPKLDRLRIIQLFEADYNFLLAVLFGHRLMGFARQHCSLNESQYKSMNSTIGCAKQDINI